MDPNWQLLVKIAVNVVRKKERYHKESLPPSLKHDGGSVRVWDAFVVPGILLQLNKCRKESSDFLA